MTYPQQQYAPQYPQQPQGFPPQQPQGFPPQQPQYQQMPQGFPQGYQMMPPQQTPPRAAPQTGTLDQFLAQEAGSGAAWSWKDKPIGTSYVGIVSGEPVIEQNSDMNTGAPATFADGRPKWTMKVPMSMVPDQMFPDGKAVWFVSGRDAPSKLVAAMREAGNPTGKPEIGAAVRATLIERRQHPRGGSPANIIRVEYRRPATPAQPHGAEPVEQQWQQQQAPQQPQAQQPQPAPFQQQGQAQQQQQPQAYAQPQQPQQPTASPAPPSNLTADQQQLLASLTGGQQ